MILPVGQWRRNPEYYKRLSDEALVAKHKEATDMWFKLLVSEDKERKDITHFQQETAYFWQSTMDYTETLMKERGLI